MRKRLLAGAALSIGVFAASAQAKDMVLEGGDNSGLTFIDADTISLHGKNIRVWQFEYWKGYQSDNVYVVKVLEEYDCSSHKYRMIQYSSYDANLNLMHSNGESFEWKYTIPDSIGESVERSVCSASYKNEKSLGSISDEKLLRFTQAWNPTNE
jgi:hypothetical protein